MFIARLTSTHLTHCGFGIWVKFDALLCRIISQGFLLHMQNLPGHLHDMIFKCNCQFSVTGGSQYCGNLMLDRRRYERAVEPEATK